jgi:hypothetical protein
LKIKSVKIKKAPVYYWDIYFRNYEGRCMTYVCVAPNRALALNSFVKFMGAARYNLLSCTTDGKAYTFH